LLSYTSKSDCGCVACCGIRSENAKKMSFVMSELATRIAAIRRVLPSGGSCHL
jgi:hypothetical protein